MSKQGAVDVQLMALFAQGHIEEVYRHLAHVQNIAQRLGGQQRRVELLQKQVTKNNQILLSFRAHFLNSLDYGMRSGHPPVKAPPMVTSQAYSNLLMLTTSATFLIYLNKSKSLFSWVAYSFLQFSHFQFLASSFNMQAGQGLCATWLERVREARLLQCPSAVCTSRDDAMVGP